MPRLASLFVCLLLAVGCAGAPTVPTVDHGADLAQRQTAFHAAMHAKDAQALSALFAEGGVVHVAGMPAVEGREAIAQFYANLFRFLAGTEARPDALRLAADGSMAYEVGRTANAFVGPQGRTTHVGKYLLVWERGGEGWLVAAYSVGSDQRDGAR